MTRQRVRCYGCGSRQSRTEEYCPRCATPFRGMCDCGSVYDLYATSCGGCGAAMEPYRLPLRRHPAVRWSRRFAAVALLGSIVYLAARPRPMQAWEVKKRADDSYARRDFEAAAEDFRRVTELKPGDAASWHMLAMSYRSLGLGDEIVTPVLRRALALRPDLVESVRLLSHLEYERGNLDAALALARRAVRLGGERGDDMEFLARLELQQPRPDLARVARTLRTAGETQEAGVDVPVLLAEVLLLRHGDSPEIALLPEVAQALRDAETAVSKEAAEDLPPAERLLLRARVRLALGRHREALRDAGDALRAVGSGAAGRFLAEIHLVQGRALLGLGMREQAYVDLKRALELEPGARIAFTIAERLSAAGQAERAEALLADTAARGDATGGIHAVLASLRLQLGEVGRALTAARTARRARPADADLAVLEGDVQRARGDHQAARELYREAERLAPDLIESRIRLALLSLVSDDEALARRPAVREAVASLRELIEPHARDPSLWRAIGTLEADAGEYGAALEALERSTVLEPLDPGAWVLLARVRAASGRSGSTASAARAYAFARRLRPDDAGLVAEEVETRLAAWDASTSVEVCSAFLGRHPDEAPILGLRARAQLQLSEYDLAARDLRRLAELGTDGRTRVLLVDTLHRAGRVQEARRAASDLRRELAAGDEPGREATLTALDVLEAVHAGDPRAATIAAVERGSSRIQVRLLLALGDLDAAVSAARVLLSETPRDDEVKQLLVFALLDRPDVPDEDLDEARSIAESMRPGRPSGMAELVLGRVLLAEERPADAIAPLRRAAATRVRDARAQLLLGEALFLSGDRDESLARYERAVALPSARRWFRALVAVRLLEAATEATDPTREEELVVAAHRLDPEGPAPAERLALLLHRRGDLPRMLLTAERALRSRRANREQADRLHLLAALANWRSGDSAGARRHLAVLSVEGADTGLAGALNAFLAIEAGRLDDADVLLARISTSLGPEASLAFVGRVECALRRRDEATVARLCERWRTCPPALRPFYLAALDLLASRGYLDLALLEVEGYRALQPGDFEALRLHVRLLRRLARPGDALGVAEAYAASAPADREVDAQLLLAWAQIHLGGDAHAGLVAARVALEHAQGSAASALLARVTAAEALLLLGRDDDAERLARALVARWPDASRSASLEARVEARVRFVLGTALANRGISGAAGDELSRSVALDPEHQLAANNLAWVLAQSDDTAERALSIAVKLTTDWPQFATYWDTRATCAVAAGNDADAETSWREARRLFEADPTSDPGARARVDLRFAGFLESGGRDEDALAIAAAVADYAAGRSEADAARDLAARLRRALK